MPSDFAIRRGLEADLPPAKDGVPLYTTDTHILYIGDNKVNIPIGGDGLYAQTVHFHSDIYEPKNTNIQSHISDTSNPHSVTALQVGAAPSIHDHNDAYEPKNTNIQTHISATGNPHNTTYDQVGAAPASHATHMSPIVAAMIFGGE